MPWIMLTKKLITKPSPPKLSIFWADPWPVGGEAAERQAEWYYKPRFDGDEPEYDADDERFPDAVGFGFEHNIQKALRINYMGVDLRVWAVECSIMTPEKMRDYLLGIPGEDIATHELVANNDASAALLRTALETDLRSIYDAALIDGCNSEMAYQVALGVNVSDDLIDFPNVGWYRCKPEFASYYCRDWEMEETPPEPVNEVFTPELT